MSLVVLSGDVAAATETFSAEKDTFVVSAFPNYNLCHLVRAESAAGSTRAGRRAIRFIVPGASPVLLSQRREAAHGRHQSRLAIGRLVT